MAEAQNAGADWRNHDALPWRRVRDTELVGPRSSTYGLVKTFVFKHVGLEYRARANAAFVERACNGYYEAQAALRVARESLMGDIDPGEAVELIDKVLDDE